MELRRRGPDRRRRRSYELRARQRRNLLGTLLLSAGVPMILGGDEIGRTQEGNNNAYCQDNELSWYDWDNVDEDLLAFTKTALALRRDNPALRPREYLRGPERRPAQMVLYRPDGQQMSDGGLAGPGGQHAGRGARRPPDRRRRRRDQQRPVPAAAQRPLRAGRRSPSPSGPRRWQVVLTSAEPGETPEITPEGTFSVEGRSLQLLQHR